ncbi:MAG: ATPase, T2SS/T4P/T4SS family [Planctomycetota bacterium]|jgi:type II secretory ATPase GspE/PulE/Tfp pilus assembly ATPase PilB-like protein
MDIAEKRLPQDGRIKRTIGGQDIDFRVSALPGYHGESIVLRILRPDAIGGQDIDFRVSALPGYHGESIVLRILRPDAVNIGLQALGFEQDDYERFLRISADNQKA